MTEITFNMQDKNSSQSVVIYGLAKLNSADFSSSPLFQILDGMHISCMYKPRPSNVWVYFISCRSY